MVMVVVMVVVMMMVMIVVAVVVMMMVVGMFHRHGFGGLGRSGEGRQGERGSQDGGGKKRFQHRVSFRSSFLPVREACDRFFFNLFIPVSGPVFP